MSINYTKNTTISYITCADSKSIPGKTQFYVSTTGRAYTLDKVLTVLVTNAREGHLTFGGDNTLTIHYGPLSLILGATTVKDIEDLSGLHLKTYLLSHMQ